MDFAYYLFIVLGFVAVVLALEGAYLLWNSRKGPEALRLQRRLRNLSAGTAANPGLVKQRTLSDLPSIDRVLLMLPRVHGLDRLLEQSGSQQTVARFLMRTAILAGAAALAAAALRLPAPTLLAAAAAAGSYPLLRALSARRKRLATLEDQLPDALDLLSRAMRAGHAFSGALNMVATEGQSPIADEFRITFDEINFGIPAQEALANLAARVPSTDLRFFVIAVLLQRDTGGNLAELLDNLSALIRARFKLLGTIRVLSAEGRLSAWILSLMPFCAAALLNLINPKFMSVLWTDPLGVNIIVAGGSLMVFGIFWMWRMVKIRV